MPSPKDLTDNVVAKHQQNLRLDAIGPEVQTIPFLKSHRILERAQITLRLVTLVATFAATLCMLTSHQSTVILGMNFDARYSYSPAFKFFAFGNAIACIFVLITLLQTIVLYRQGTCLRSCHCLLVLHDMIILVLVTAVCAAATAIGNVGMHGNPHTGWAPICDHFRKFCRRVTISITFSYVSVVCSLMLTAVSAMNTKEIMV